MRCTILEIVLFTLLSVAFVRGGEHEQEGVLIIEPVAGQFVHSEGPHWDYRIQCLIFVDIDAQRIYRYNPSTRNVTYTYIQNGPVGVAVPVNGRPNLYVAGAGRDFVLVTWNSDSNYTKPDSNVLTTVDAAYVGNRWNDGKVDSSGRFWGGTIGPEVNNVVVPNQASLYRITDDLKPKVEISPVTNSNGLAWNWEDTIFYYIDTPTLQIAQFDYSPHSGTISNKRIAFDLKQNNITGLPDGMTIDTDNNLWIALYNGFGVLHVNPNTGKVLRFVEMPVKQVTSVAFGGPNLDILYVTTSSRGLSAEEKKQQPYAGYVFAVKGLGVHGLLANSFKYNP